MSDIKKKLEILGGFTRYHSMSGLLAQRIADWMGEGKVVQKHPAGMKYNEPSGQSYVGAGHGESGGSTISDWHYSTYDGCREVSIAGDTLSVRIFEGDIFGRRIGPANPWIFSLHFDWTTDVDLVRIINQDWEEMLQVEFEAREIDRVNKAIEELGEKLLRGVQTPCLIS